MGPINMKDARKRLSELVSAAERGESTVITRRGRKVARLVPVDKERRRGLPDLKEFRSSIKVKGKGLSQTVIAMRSEERY